MMRVTASQIRQDLNCFGGFGQQGYGYNVRYLHDKIGDLLGISEGYRAVIVGAGNLGRALVSSHMFDRRGVKRLAMFDVDPSLIGTTVADVPVYDVRTLRDFCTANAVDIGVVTTPKEAAASVIETLTAAGIRGIWNFSPVKLNVPKDVHVENADLAAGLAALSHLIRD
jgi:redox-sensing transcriptional repressor